jgi:ribonuclease-3
MTQIEKLESLYETLGYQFKQENLIVTALTHSSFANEAKGNVRFNERLEFLGDSVLGLTISDYLYRTYPELPEGALTKLRAGVVSEVSLAQIARQLDLGNYLRLGKGEEITGGRDRASVLADAMESVIGAMYLDSGLETAKEFVLRLLIPSIEILIAGKGHKDYKTDLQELLQSKSNLEITYQITNEEGPDHDKLFTAQVSHGDLVIGHGQGKSKKEAEQQAAQNALDKLARKDQPRGR